MAASESTSVVASNGAGIGLGVSNNVHVRSISLLATASTSAPAQKALSDTADLIRDINPLFGF
ncbi:hypothetical protein [Paenibacillus odorifer]|uniref:hypothetical protein n=1 Tax=Paenibacillus odorifer TaxID=189426 RepID=UPI001115721A|nr:hypothetical protein [Paenibacillus odorifer]